MGKLVLVTECKSHALRAGDGQGAWNCSRSWRGGFTAWAGQGKWHLGNSNCLLVNWELFVGKLGTVCWSSGEETNKQASKIHKRRRSKTKGGFPGSKSIVCVQEPEEFGFPFANSRGKQTVKGEK